MFCLDLFELFENFEAIEKFGQGGVERRCFGKREAKLQYLLPKKKIKFVQNKT